MCDRQYFVVDGPFAGELCALELGRHVNDIDLYLDDGRVATYKVDGYASLLLVGIDWPSTSIGSRAA